MALTTAEAAKKIGLCVQRIQALCRQGRITGAVRNGRDWMIPEDFTIRRDGTRGPQGVKTIKEKN